MKLLPKIEKYSTWGNVHIPEHKALVYHVYYNWLNLPTKVEYRLYHELTSYGIFTHTVEWFLRDFQLPQEKQYRFINRNNSTSGELKLVNSSNTPPVQNAGLQTLMRSIKEVLAFVSPVGVVMFLVGVFFLLLTM